MRARDIIICLTALVIGVTLLTTAGNQLSYINTQRKQMNLVRNEPLENAPPSLAFATVAMGAFRGLIVDILWIRADALKEKGQFFDARQLAEWIVTLQPRFSRVWAFQAWNMAYNLSVTIPASEPEQRWRWVKNGYELLRDKGIPLNPTDISLYRELALIFQHKIGGITDDAHKYYKLQLAQAMAPLLGPADEQYFEKLVAAPKKLDQIIADANVAEFINALKAADETFADDKNLASNYLALRQEPKKFKPEAFKVIDNYRNTETLEKFDIFAKAWQLRNVWKLEPELMQEINKTYGPINFEDPNHHLPMDWRNADVHALYWAVKGLRMEPESNLSIGEANTDRIVSHSLQNLYRYGTMFIYDIPPSEQIEDDTRPDRRPQLTRTVYLRPDLRMFDSYNKTQLAIIEKYKPDKGIYESLQTGHKNFLRNAVLSFYQAGHEQYARKIYKELQKLYPDEDSKVEFTVFLRNRLRNEVQELGITDAREIMLMLREAYFYYAMRDDDEAYRREQIAAQVHKQYTTMYKGEEHRINLPSMSRLKYLSLIDFLSDTLYPLSLRQSLAARIRLERPDLAEQLENEEEKYLQEQQTSVGPVEPNQQQTNQP
jgi:hypothetical protein